VREHLEHHASKSLIDLSLQVERGLTCVGGGAQVKAGSIFDNILVCDDPDYAKAQAEKYIVPFQKGEKEMKEKADKEEAEKRRQEEEDRKAR